MRHLRPPPQGPPLDLVVTRNHHLHCPLQSSLPLRTMGYFLKFLQFSNSKPVSVPVQLSKPRTLPFLTAHHLRHVLTSQLTQLRVHVHSSVCSFADILNSFAPLPLHCTCLAEPQPLICPMCRLLLHLHPTSWTWLEKVHIHADWPH